MNKINKFNYKATFEVSWVGECPWTNTLCLGGEDGQLLIESAGPTEMGRRKPWLMQVATDAINEAAFVGDLIAVSSRNEVVVARRSTPEHDALDRYDLRFIGGAHGVVASRSGAFLAPIADQGLLMLKVEDGRLGAGSALLRKSLSTSTISSGWETTLMVRCSSRRGDAMV